MRDLPEKITQPRGEMTTIQKIQNAIETATTYLTINLSNAVAILHRRLDLLKGHAPVPPVPLRPSVDPFRGINQIFKTVWGKGGGRPSGTRMSVHVRALRGEEVCHSFILRVT